MMIERNTTKTSMIKRQKYLKQLHKWSKSPISKPLVLRGARQVGKTSLVRSFAEDAFENYIEVNLEKDVFSVLLNRTFSIEEFEDVVSSVVQKSFVSNKTLLFIDEIQNSPQIYSLLRYYYEERKEIKVIAAGSLLEPYLKRANISMPVGRVWTEPLPSRI